MAANFLLRAAAAAFVVSSAGLAHAQGVSLPPDDIIAARQAGYDLMAGNLIGMKNVIDQKGDVKPLVDSAKALASWGHVVPTLFPPGTEQGHHTHAKPNVWSDRAGFEKAAANFTGNADRLAQLAEANDKSGFAAQYKETTRACGACHHDYRARE